MGKLPTLKSCSVCLVVLAAAACRGPAGNNVYAEQTNGAPVNEAAYGPVENASANTANTAYAETDTGTVYPAGATRPYTARGTEPGWTLTIGGGRMRFAPMEGRPISEPLPPRTPIPGGYRYAGRQMTVEIVHRPCGLSEEQDYPDEVQLRVGYRPLDGCGGDKIGELG